MFASTALIAALLKSKAVPTHTKAATLSREAIDAVVKQTQEDATSSAGSQTTIVDEDDSIVLRSRVKLALEALLAPRAAGDEVRLLDAQHAIEYVAYALSDLVFSYPVNQSTASLQDQRNAQGELVKTVAMETRAGALQAVQGALAGTTKQAAVLTSSQALLSMIPNLHALALARQPLVLHVAAYAVDSELVAHPQVDCVLAARNSGAILLSSQNVQEAHDMAIVAHAIARATQLPVIHYFDGSANAIQRASLQPFQKLAEVNKVPAANNDPYVAAEQILSQHGYKPFEYTGAKDAETVLVALGASSQPVANAVKDSAYGLISVRLYRPWSEAGFIRELPASVRQVVVLEQGDGLFAFNGPLFLDVAAAIRFGRLTSKPRLAIAQAASFAHLAAEHLPLLAADAAKATFIDLHAEQYNVTTAKEDNLYRALFWDVEQDGSVQAAVHAAHLHEATEAQTARDAYRVGGPVVFTQVGDKRSKAQYISVHNVQLTKEFDILSSAANKATVLLHGPWKHGDEIEPHLTNEFKLALTQKDIQLYTLDGARIAEELGLNRQSSHLVWEAAFLILNNSTNPESRLTALYEDDKADIKALVRSVVKTVKEQLARVELLPPWTILEINDIKLPAVPVHRAVAVDDEAAQALATAEAAGADGEEAVDAEVGRWHQAAWQVMFKEAYGTETAVRPDLHEQTFVIKLAENKRLTPASYDRNVFHLEFDTTGSNLKYSLGDALGVHGHNDSEEVMQFLEWYGLKHDDVVVVPNEASGKREARTVFQLFSQTLDIFGRPSKKFYEALASYATDPKEKEQLLFLVSAEGKEEYKKRVDDTVTFEDLLREFTSAKPPLEALAHIITPIKPRHYSIASSQRMHPNSVHLLIVAVDWVTPAGKKRYGQCTRYLADMKVGADVTVSIKPSVMKLPPLDEQPVIMAGLGTGMAPFRAFIQERAMYKAEGRKVGPMVLYFGSRNRRMEYLYGEELEAYHADGVLSHMGLAFSRDQKQKVYIQHKMMEDAQLLHDYLITKNGHFYLCGPTWPVPDVKDAVVYGLKNFGGIDEKVAGDLIEEWKEKEKYILEVY